jgi:hypothetical protein
VRVPKLAARSVTVIAVPLLLAAAVVVPVTAAAARTTSPGAAASATSATATSHPIVGDWNVTYGAPAVVKMTRSGRVYTETAKTPVRVVGSSCDLPVGTVIATFHSTGSHSYKGRHGLWYTSNCSFAYWTSWTLTLSSNGYRLTGVITAVNETIKFTKISATITPTRGAARTKVKIESYGVINNQRGAAEYWCPRVKRACGNLNGPGSTAKLICAGAKVTKSTSTCTGVIPASASGKGKHDIYSWQAKSKRWALATFTLT